MLVVPTGQLSLAAKEVLNSGLLLKHVNSLLVCLGLRKHKYSTSSGRWRRVAGFRARKVGCQVLFGGEWKIEGERGPKIFD